MPRYGFLLAFALAALLPLGILPGGPGYWLVPLAVFGVIPLLDVLIGEDVRNPPEAAADTLRRDRFYTRILLAWVIVQLLVLAFSLIALRLLPLSVPEAVGLVVSTGILSGGIGITVAHELGHRLGRRERLGAQILLISVGYLHFLAEHNRGHHVNVATPLDPATARRGESFYRFLPRTVGGSFRHAWRLERDRLARVGRGPWTPANLALRSVLASGIIVGGLALAGGLPAVAWWLGQAAIAVGLLELVNYVEHYGLERCPLPAGGFERVQPWHSWNTARRVTNLMLFNLQRHSHHHVRATRPYQLLAHLPESPQLPTGYPGMILLALCPPLWRRVMDTRINDWKMAASNV